MQTIRQRGDGMTIGMAIKQGVKFVFGWCGCIADHGGTQSVQMADLGHSQFHLLGTGARLENGVEMTWVNASSAKVVAETVVGQITFAAERSLSCLDRFFKWQMFEAMQRVVMHECSHRPIIGDRLARKPDQRSQLHPLALVVGLCCYLSHSIVSMARS